MFRGWSFITVLSIPLWIFCVNYTFKTIKISSPELIQQSTQTTEIQPWTDFTLKPGFVKTFCDNYLNIKQWAVRVPKRPRICFVPGDEFMSGVILENGNWENAAQNILFKHLMPKFPQAVFFDIGANIGVYTVSAALLGRRVFTFEPILNTLESLTQTVAINNLTETVTIFPYALMDSKMCVYSSLFISKSNVGATKLLEDRNCKRAENIRVTTLDNMLPLLNLKNINQVIIKMDIEGSEPNAIIGGQKFLEEVDVPYILMEFHNIVKPMNSKSRKNGSKRRKFLEAMLILGRKFYPTTLLGGKKLNIMNLHKCYEDVLWIKK